MTQTTILEEGRKLPIPEYSDTTRQSTSVLPALHRYDGPDDVLKALLIHDENFARSSATRSMRTRYRHTLDTRPCTKCACNSCKDVGIHVLILRAVNRNRRRGAHNTPLPHNSMYRHQP